MEYEVRKAEEKDLCTVFSLYAAAREFMARSGNPHQWGSTGPDKSRILQDLEGGNLYVLTEHQQIHGVFAFLIFEDPTYRIIENGAWHSGRPYGVIHRVAGDGSGGILKAAVSYAETFIDYLRIDTHRDNLPMQRSILRCGFSPCGTIYTENGSERIAYDRLK